MKHLFIVNPAAGSYDRTEEYRQIIHTVCEKRGIAYEIQVSQAPGECRRLARAAGESGEEYRIYACGGDGTLNEIVSGAAGFPNVAVTAFPGGSGNDFVKIFDDPDAFCHLERLLESREAVFDLIRCNDAFALNVCSVGLDARIGTDVGNYKRFPFLHGFSAYIVSTIVNVIRGIAQHYVVEIDGEVIDGEQTFICVCNGRFYGGGFNPVPEAEPDDGMLDVLLVSKVTRLQVPGLIGRYKNGRYREIPRLVRHFRTQSISIRCDRPNAVNLDGELMTADTVEIGLAAEKIRFFYPKELSYRAVQGAEQLQREK